MLNGFMVTVIEAEKLIAESVRLSAGISCSLPKAAGKILRETVFADRDQPPFHRVAMDGIAIDFAAWKKGQRKFHHQDIQKAGQAPLALDHKDSCIEVMTGTTLPQGCDTVVRIEEVTFENGFCILREENIPVTKNQNVHLQGLDIQQGQIVLAENTHLGPAEIAIAASMGKTHLQVSALPRIAIIATGDELVEIHEQPLPYQIRLSNVYAIEAALKLWGCEHISRHHFNDNEQILLHGLKKLLAENDLLILSGGVSAGRFDYVPHVLRQLEVTEIFHKVKQKPGKPLWFGKGPQGQFVFGLPGNPMSALTCLTRYVQPLLQGILGEKKPQIYTVLKENVKASPLTIFCPVALEYSRDGSCYAQPIKHHGSGDFAALTHSQGVIELNSEFAHEGYFPKGYVAPFFAWVKN